MIPGPLWIAPFALLLIGAASERDQTAKPLPSTGTLSQLSKAEQTHCAPFVTDPADAVRRGTENPLKKSSSGLSLGVAYLVEGCIIDVTPDGLHSPPPKGFDGRWTPLEPG